jgi:nucleoside-diphosphate-sugar epimerase
MSNTVLILGARGRFGDAAARAFAAAGWRVLAQMRPTAPAAAPPAPSAHPGITPLALPLAQTDALVAAARGARVLVHAVNPVYTRWQAEAMPALHQGVAVARRLGAHFMLPGNVYHYGSTLPPRLDEDTPAAPDTPQGLVRAEMEAALAAETAMHTTVIRAGDFFGHGRGSWLDLVIAKSLATGRLVYPGPLDVPHAWAYLPDLARAFVAVAEAEGRECTPRFESLHFAGYAATGQEFLAALQTAAATIGAAPAGPWRLGGFPWPLIRAGGLLVPMWREVARMRYLWSRPHALAGTRLAARIGAQATTSTPLVDALSQSLRGLGHGPIPAPSCKTA